MVTTSGLVLIELPVFWLVIVMGLCTVAGVLAGREWERGRVRDVENHPDNVEGELGRPWTLMDEVGGPDVLRCTPLHPSWRAEVHEGARIAGQGEGESEGEGTSMVCPNCGITWREMP
jgi:hypothetical protein